MSDFARVPGPGGGAVTIGQLGPPTGQRYGKNAPHPALESPLSKSWLFEIVDRQSGVIQESFTLIFPPQSLSIKEPQRVSITKTFGSVFVDDYGPDNIQITLKGISGTTQVFPTFTTTGRQSNFTDIAAAVSGASQAASNSLGYTGKNAFYTFRNNIIRYKDRSSWEQTELRVYDLADEQAYKCVLLDFSLDRNSDSPLRYPFTISLFVYDKLDKVKIKPGVVVNISRDPTAALNDIDNSIGVLEQLYRDVLEAQNQIALVKSVVLELRTRIARQLGEVAQFLTSPLNITKNLIDIGISTGGVLYDAFLAGRFTFERYAGAVELFQDIITQA